MEYHSAFKKKEILPYDNMDEPWEHDAKGSKVVTERQTLHDLTYMR